MTLAPPTMSIKIFFIFKRFRSTKDNKAPGTRDVKLNFVLGKTLVLKYGIDTSKTMKNIVFDFIVNKTSFTHFIRAYLYTIIKIVFLLENGMSLMACSNLKLI